MAEALDHLGAYAFLISSDGAAMAEAGDSLDYILDTVLLAVRWLDHYMSLLKAEGKLFLIGVAQRPLQFENTALIGGKRREFVRPSATQYLVYSSERSSPVFSF